MDSAYRETKERVWKHGSENVCLQSCLSVYLLSAQRHALIARINCETPGTIVTYIIKFRIHINLMWSWPPLRTTHTISCHLQLSSCIWLVCMKSVICGYIVWFAVCCEVIMYTYEELTSMHYMYGSMNGNALEASCLYREWYPMRWLPDQKTFEAIHCCLCEHGSFARPPGSGGQWRSTYNHWGGGGRCSQRCTSKSWSQHKAVRTAEVCAACDDLETAMRTPTVSISSTACTNFATL
jgi:hypothetical protein